MSRLPNCHIRRGNSNQFATSEDFQKLFTDELDSLYYLSFLLTCDQDLAEKCFLAGLEDCIKTNRVFKEWARSWARRTIVHNAIRELKPRPRYTGSSVSSTVSPYIDQQSSRGDGDVGAVLALEDFERFVFVMSVLEHYSDGDSALLLGCFLVDIRNARTRAVARIVSSSPASVSSEINFEQARELSR